MNRRAFLELLAAAGVGAATLDLERLLWVPKPMITVPAMPSIRAYDGVIHRWRVGFSNGGGIMGRGQPPARFSISIGDTMWEIEPSAWQTVRPGELVTYIDVPTPAQAGLDLT